MFHEIAASPNGLKRTIVVERARPDPGALAEREVAGDDGQESTIVAEGTAEEASEGFIDFYILTYRNGVLSVDDSGSAIKERASRSQTRFVELLKIGR